MAVAVAVARAVDDDRPNVRTRVAADVVDAFSRRPRAAVDACRPCAYGRGGAVAAAAAATAAIGRRFARNCVVIRPRAAVGVRTY